MSLTIQKYYGVHKAIIIDNYDQKYPLSGRVQIFAPEIHGLTLQALFKGGTEFSFNFLGDNIPGAISQDVVNLLKSFCPWALQCVPITSDFGPGFYDAERGIASETENPCQSLSAVPNHAANYNTPQARANTLSPYSNPSWYSVKKADPNPWARPPALTNLPKGNFTIPRVGASVIVQFLGGDVNYPIIMGGLPSINQFAEIFSALGLNKADSQTNEIKNNQ